MLDSTNSDWFDLKEEENVDRRKAITSMCSTLDFNVKEVMENSIETLFLSEKHKMAYCKVPKIASTSWTHFFIRTGDYGITLTP